MDRCLSLAKLSEEPGRITRAFLSPPMQDAYQMVRAAMEAAGLIVSVDAIGNVRGWRPGCVSHAPRLVIASHIDTVPNAGAYDGVLGVMLGIGLVEMMCDRRLDFGLEVIAFSEEEGVRFGVPFLGSRAFTGTFDPMWLQREDAEGVGIAQAVGHFGLDPSRISEAAFAGEALGYLEFHIEQGPVLESLHLPLGVVAAIAGQSRFQAVFTGEPNHAGTTPMHLRRDALAGAAEWITLVEREALATEGLVATVGRIDAQPGAGNVIAGEVTASLDVRHAVDGIRSCAVDRLFDHAREIATRRRLVFRYEPTLDQPATPCDSRLTGGLADAVAAAGYPVHRMVSGAGHDAMVVAGRIPIAMLFLRSPGGISHHPSEAVNLDDVAAALEVGVHFIDWLQHASAWTH
ncbi:MAG: allantoate amidohydrolase [Bryobacteraceae bacterium]